VPGSPASWLIASLAFVDWPFPCLTYVSFVTYLERELVGWDGRRAGGGGRTPEPQVSA
jgi:hypothetical protein